MDEKLKGLLDKLDALFPVPDVNVCHKDLMIPKIAQLIIEAAKMPAVSDFKEGVIVEARGVDGSVYKPDKPIPVKVEVKKKLKEEQVLNELDEAVKKAKRDDENGFKS